MDQKGIAYEDYPVNTDAGRAKLVSYYKNIREKLQRTEDGALLVPILIRETDTGEIKDIHVYKDAMNLFSENG